MAEKRFRVDCDLTEVSLDEARIMLVSRVIGNLHVFCGETNSMAARKLQGIHGFELTVVPDAMLATRFAWAAQYGNEVVWSAPV